MNCLPRSSKLAIRLISGSEVQLTNAHRLLHLLQLVHIHDGGCVGGGLREKDDCRATC